MQIHAPVFTRVYTLVGMALAFLCYRRGLPLKIRSALFPLLGDRVLTRPVAPGPPSWVIRRVF